MCGERSIYHESLVALNAQLKARGKPAVVITRAPAVLEDDDLLEMVNAGLVPITIVDDYLAAFWSQVFTNIKVHRDVTVRSGGQLAVAMRKESPKLREAASIRGLRSTARATRSGTSSSGAISKSVKYVKNAAADAERQKLLEVVELFKKYGGQVQPRLRC